MFSTLSFCICPCGWIDLVHIYVCSVPSLHMEAPDVLLSGVAASAVVMLFAVGVVSPCTAAG